MFLPRIRPTIIFISVLSIINMQNLRKIVQKVRDRGMPHPLRYFKQKYKIEQDLKDIREMLVRKKYKIGLGAATVVLVCSKQRVQESLEGRLEEELYSNLSKEQKTFNFFISFLKQSLIEVLQDPQSKREGAHFLEEVSRQQQVVDSLAGLMVAALKDQDLRQETYSLLKSLLSDLLKDPEVERDLRQLLIRTMQDPEVRVELLELLKASLTSPQVADGLVRLFEVGFQDDIMKAATKELFQHALFEILLDENTAEKFKLFGYFILEQQDPQSQKQVQNIIDGIADKLVQKKSSPALPKDAPPRRFYFF